MRPARNNSGLSLGTFREWKYLSKNGQVFSEENRSGPTHCFAGKRCVGPSRATGERGAAWGI
jgi:hypothetical protein